MGAVSTEMMLAIIDAVEKSDMPGHSRYELKKFITEQCQLAGIKAIDRSERVRFARTLLDAREQRPIIRNRLMARFGISRSAAYEAIDSALKLSRNH